ncbi:hypothetical protein [Halomonas halocynthiae]|uniref:hypothetical protein n=1 Tax=Halomonas halocynthiae TaxID=176290 RepID=UPI00047F11BE|nr:hypothetical protein [Halomonas halocynthiae]
MPKVRQYADSVTSLAGLMWIVLYWSVWYSVSYGRIEPALIAFLIVATATLFSSIYRPARIMLGRYHVRKRRTEMWMHILALPITLAFLLAVLVDYLLFPVEGVNKMLLFCVLATAGWLVFVVTLLFKLAVHTVSSSTPSSSKS